MLVSAHTIAGIRWRFQPDRANIGACQFAVGQGNSADCIKQHIGQRGEQHPVLIGPPFVATGAVGEQVQLKQRYLRYLMVAL